MPSSKPTRSKVTSTDQTLKKSKVSRGREYEQRAAQFYANKGYRVLETNWQASHKEIDLIVRKGNAIVFVEVKSGNSAAFGHPVERVNKKKIDNLTRAAQTYLIKKEIADCDLRFDIVTFFQGQLEHFPNAFSVD